MGLAALLAARSPEPSPGGTRSTAQESLRAIEIAERRHRVTLLLPPFKNWRQYPSHDQQRATGGERKPALAPPPDVNRARDGRDDRAGTLKGTPGGRAMTEWG
jgi:hypothetical protein